MFKQGSKSINNIFGRRKNNTNGINLPSQQVHHNSTKFDENNISSAYSVFDSDLASDNLDNDLPAADLQDL